MSTYLLAYAATALIFFPVDLLWLGVVAQKFYQRQLGDMMEINMGVAIVFYLVYIIGIVYFAVAPAIERESLAHAALAGALFGFFCYATYDLTNLATLKGYPAGVVIPDIIWGTVLTGVSASGGFLLFGVLRDLFA